MRSTAARRNDVIRTAAAPVLRALDPPGREPRHYSAFAPRLTHGDADILKAQHFLQANEGRDARLATLTEQAGLEKRTLLRRFQKATGLTTTELAQRLRVAKAQELLQLGCLPVERVSWEVGNSDAGTGSSGWLWESIGNTFTPEGP